MGFQRTLTDQQFIAEADKMQLPLTQPVNGVEATRLIDEIYAVPPALIARVKEIVR